jgi:enoyl-CoA hydratase
VEEHVLSVTTADGVTEITLDRPTRRNALDAALRTQLADAVRAFDADPHARVAIVTGRDPAFCAGVDLDELSRTGVRFGTGPTFEQVLRATSKPLVGAINGATVTGGLELALSLDFLIASERARFGDTHSRVGVVAGGGLTVLLVHAVGIRMARQMSFTGALIDAQTALRAGLVNEVVPHEQLLPRTREVAAQIAAIDPVLVAAHRAAYWRAVNLPADEALAAERLAATGAAASAEVIAGQRDAVIGSGRASLQGGGPE